MQQENKNDVFSAARDSRSTLTGGGLLAKNTIFNLLGQIIPMIVAVVTIPLIINAMGVGRFGVLTLAWMVVGYFSLFDMGLGRATTKFVAECLPSGDHEKIIRIIWGSLILMAAFGIMGAVIALLLTPVLIRDILNIPPELIDESRRAFYLLALSIPVVSMTAGARGVLEAQQRFDYVNIVKVPVYTAAFITPLAVLPFSNSLVPIVGVLILSRLIGLLAYLFFCFRATPGLSRIRFPGKALIRELLGYGGWLTISNLVWPLMTYMDRFVIGAMLTMAAVAYYVTPYELVAKMLIITGSFLGVIFPAFSTFSAGRHEELMQLFNRAVKYLLVILVPAVFAVVILAKPFFKIWLGDEFVIYSAVILQILALGKLINSVSQVPSSAIQAMGRPDITAKLHLAELPIYILMLYVFVHAFGIIGAAVAWTVRVVIDSAIYFYLYYRLSPVSAEKRIKPPANLIVWSVAIVGLAFAISTINYIPLKIILSLATAATGFIYARRHFIDKHEKEYLVRLFGKLTLRRRGEASKARVDLSKPVKQEKVGK